MSDTYEFVFSFRSPFAWIAAHHVVPDPDEAWERALRITPPGDVLLVTGSFYLLGDLTRRSARLPRWGRQVGDFPRPLG